VIDRLRSIRRAARVALRSSGDVEVLGSGPLRVSALDMAAYRARGFASQHGQDVVLAALFRGLGVEEGVFVDVGAHDGLTGSNTLFFERDSGWRGVCVEPLPEPFARLASARTARCINCAVGDLVGVEDFLAVSGYAEMLSGIRSQFDQAHTDRIAREIEEYGGSQELLRVQVRRLDEILEESNIHHVDFLSVDVEGAELSVMRSLDFAATTVVAMAIENNLDDDVVAHYVEQQSDLRRVCRLGGDDIYLNLSASAKLLLG
jgi:FkbM family methyltransferase